MKLTDESDTVWRDLRKRRWPFKLKRIVLEPRLDSRGDEGLYVWVVVPNTTREDDLVLENTQPISDRVKELLRDMGDERWPLVMFRTETEYEEMGRG